MWFSFYVVLKNIGIKDDSIISLNGFFLFLYFSSSLQWKMHSFHALFLQFIVINDISKTTYFPKSWISPKIMNIWFKGFLLLPKEG